MYSLNVNGKVQKVDAESEMPLLWVLREVIGLTGTKFGCGIAQCGACTVHVDGQPVRSCSVPGSAMTGRKITTIEGLSDSSSHPVQKAWAEVDVPQCGYCQSGQIMAAVALLKRKPANQQRHRCGHDQHLSMWDLSAHTRSHSCCGRQ